MVVWRQRRRVTGSGASRSASARLRRAGGAMEAPVHRRCAVRPHDPVRASRGGRLRPRRGAGAAATPRGGSETWTVALYANADNDLEYTLAAVHPSRAQAHPRLAGSERRRAARQGGEDRLVPLPHQRPGGHDRQALHRGARLRRRRDVPVVPRAGPRALPVRPPDRRGLGPRLRLAVLLARLQRRRQDHHAGAAGRARGGRRPRGHPRVRRLQHGRRGGGLGRRLGRRPGGAGHAAGRLLRRLGGDDRPGRLSLRRHVRAARRATPAGRPSR